MSKTGFITRSYSITVHNDNQNVNNSFPNLDPENTKDILGDYTVSGNRLIRETTNGDTISGNSVSNNSIDDRK